MTMPAPPSGTPGMAQVALALRRRRPRPGTGTPRGLAVGQHRPAFLARHPQGPGSHPPGFPAGPPRGNPVAPPEGLPPLGGPAARGNPGRGGQGVALPALAGILRQLGGPSRRMPVQRPY